MSTNMQHIFFFFPLFCPALWQQNCNLNTVYAKHICFAKGSYMQHILMTTLAWQSFMFQGKPSLISSETLLCVCFRSGLIPGLSAECWRSNIASAHSDCLCWFSLSFILCSRWRDDSLFGRSSLVTEVDRRSPVYRHPKCYGSLKSPNEVHIRLLVTS